MLIKFRNGDIDETDSIEDALEFIRERWSDAVAYQDGSKVEDDGDMSGDSRVLVWADEASSVNNDGAKAIAEVIP